MKILNLFMAAVMTATVPMHSFAQSAEAEQRGTENVSKDKVERHLKELEQKIMTAKALLAKAQQSEREGYVRLEKADAVRLYSSIATISSLMVGIVSFVKLNQTVFKGSAILFFTSLMVVFSNEFTAQSQRRQIDISKEKMIQLSQEIDSLQTSVQTSKALLSQIQQ